MNKFFIIIVLIFAFIAVGNGQEKSENNIQTVDFCKLFKNPKLYNEKLVRVTAIYRYGYEWSDIFCLACEGEKLMRLKLGDDFDSNTKKKVRKQIKWSPRGRTVKVVAVGRMYVNETGFKRFVADYFESADVLVKNSRNDFLDRLDEKTKQKEKCLIRVN